jgi:hypothetical protein
VCVCVCVIRTPWRVLHSIHTSCHANDKHTRAGRARTCPAQAPNKTGYKRMCIKLHSHRQITHIHTHTHTHTHAGRARACHTQVSRRRYIPARNHVRARAVQRVRAPALRRCHARGQGRCRHSEFSSVMMSTCTRVTGASECEGATATAVFFSQHPRSVRTGTAGSWYTQAHTHTHTHIDIHTYMIHKWHSILLCYVWTIHACAHSHIRSRRANFSARFVPMCLVTKAPLPLPQRVTISCQDGYSLSGRGSVTPMCLDSGPCAYTNHTSALPRARTCSCAVFTCA